MHTFTQIRAEAQFSSGEYWGLPDPVAALSEPPGNTQQPTIETGRMSLEKGGFNYQAAVLERALRIGAQINDTVSLSPEDRVPTKLLLVTLREELVRYADEEGRVPDWVVEEQAVAESQTLPEGNLWPDTRVVSRWRDTQDGFTGAQRAWLERDIAYEIAFRWASIRNRGLTKRETNLYETPLGALQLSGGGTNIRVKTNPQHEVHGSQILDGKTHHTTRATGEQVLSRLVAVRQVSSIESPVHTGGMNYGL